MSKSIVLYLHVHQPDRIRDYGVFDTGYHHNYFESNDRDVNWNNQKIFEKIANKSYRPMNKLLLKLLRENPEFKLSLSITGSFIDQAQKWAPDVLKSFQELAATGRVDILAETYYHSLAFFYSKLEFEKQVIMHREKIESLFGIRPKVFRNTELSYNNDIGTWAENAGYKGILAEGWDPILGWRSPNFVYKTKNTNLPLLLKNYKLSDDIAFRFSDKSWPEYPLTAEKYIDWLSASMQNQEPIVNIFLDYETFGEHQWKDTGIFDFFASLVEKWIIKHGSSFMTTLEAVTNNRAVDEIDVINTTSWADTERDLSAWLGNSMQREALNHLYDLEDSVLRTGDDSLISDWRYLQESDHVYYMCTKNENDNQVHKYFSPYDSPYDAFIYFMNALRDVRWRVLEYRKQGM
jgi:alpha-amylase